MAWQPPTTDAVDTGWQPPASDAIGPSTWQKIKVGYNIANMLPSPWQTVRQNTLDPLGEKTAELGGRMGYPLTGAAIGTAVQMAPELAMAYAGLKGIYGSTNPTVQGLVNTPKELSPQYTAQNEAIGISGEVPETASNVKYADPYQYASQLTKPKYAKVTPPDLPVVQPSTTGTPHAAFDYNDPITGKSSYQIFGDPTQHGYATTPNVPFETLQEKGIPVVGQTEKAVGLGQAPLDAVNGPTIQPVANPGGASFTRPRLQYPAESGIGAAQPLPSTIPIKYPSDPGTLINQANSRISQFGQQLTPQELSDYKDLISTKMATGEIPKFGLDGRISPLFAKASQVSSTISNTLNRMAEPLLKNANLPEGTIPTRAGLNQAYQIATKQQAIADFMKKYAIKGAETAGGGAGLAALYNYFKK